MKLNLRNIFATPVALFINLLLSMAVFIICRGIYYLVNMSYFPGLGWGDFLSIVHGGFMFDLSGLLYVNAIYIVLMAFPLHYKEQAGYQKFTKAVFIILNTLVIVANLMDAVYFRFTNRRTTASVFKEFSAEGNIGAIVGAEVLHYWYLTLAAALLVWLMFKLYRKPAPLTKPFQPVPYYLVQLVVFVGIIPLSVFGIRGGIGYAVRPITISNANQYVQRPIEAALVLNTPFAVIRTLGKTVYHNPGYFKDPAEMERLFTPVHRPQPDGPFKPMNVVVFIMESFGREYVGALNRDIDGGNYRGYTPFLDSLIQHSLTFEYSFANGRKSIDGMPSVLSSLPMFIEPYFVTHYSLNRVSGIAGELGKKGYHTSFFHGAPNGSMGFEAFSRTTGFEHYYGMTEYGDKDAFDGTWAIWDEEFFQFFAEKLGTFRQPFASALFSASSHHPYKIPERYKEVFPEGPMDIHKCVRYTDYALKRFFETASRQPWFKNTLFVITADHTNQTYLPMYKNDCGLFSVPIIFYQPEDKELQGMRPTIAQQIDILPTVLGYLNYDRPFIGYGRDLRHTSDSLGFAVNYTNQIYQYFKGDYMLQFDGSQSRALYDFKHDRFLRENLLGRVPKQATMEAELKAIIQQYIERMISDRMVPDEAVGEASGK